MRNMSFSATTKQFRDRRKDVTRRLGWRTLAAGEVLQGIEKGQGLRRGEKVVAMGRIRVLDVRLEPLNRMTLDRAYGYAEVRREGFPLLKPEEFVDWYAEEHGITPATLVTRIEFEYLDEEAHGDRPK